MVQTDSTVADTEEREPKDGTETHGTSRNPGEPFFEERTDAMFGEMDYLAHSVCHFMAGAFRMHWERCQGGESEGGAWLFVCLLFCFLASFFGLAVSPRF